jgi:hypothetical protein
VTAEAGPSHLADEVLDELLPEDLDWRGLVERHPRACLGAAMAAGFWLGWKRGDLILAGLGAFAATQVGQAVRHHLEE